MATTIFISYATSDSQKYQIAKVASLLEEHPEIDRVLYWEEHMEDDIYKYMNDNLALCDVMLIFCSTEALRSEAVEMEWMAALKLKKKIIPVFEEEDHIPPLLTTKLGVVFQKKDLPGTVEALQKLIIKKKKSLVQEEERGTVSYSLEMGGSREFSLEEVTRQVACALFGGQKELKMADRSVSIQQYTKSKIRYAQIDSYKFLEQNPAKRSHYGNMAREGHKILWVLKGSTYYARMVDDEFVYL